MFLVHRLAVLQPSTLLKSEALHKHFAQLILMFLHVSYVLHNICNDYVSSISERASKSSDHLHQEAVTNRYPFKYMLFKIIHKEVHFSLKLQAVELKHLQFTISHFFNVWKLTSISMYIYIALFYCRRLYHQL